MPFLNTSDTGIYYETNGSGPPIVFAHGAGGNHLSWWQQVPYFSRGGYTCITFDHRGFGQSVDPRPPAERPSFDDDLAALIEHLGHQQVRLVAQSMGGRTCLAYTVKHPDRVAALVMADTTGSLTSPEIDAARAASRERLGSVRLLDGAISQGFRQRDPAGAFLYESVFALNPPRDPNAAPGSTEPITPEQTKALRVPVLFVEGSVDVLVPPEVIQAAQPLFADARIHMVEDAGHSVYFEKPAEFNRAVESFFKEQGAAA
jgi:3-oxoadipate enol-lactonase